MAMPTATRVLVAFAVWFSLHGMWCFGRAEGEKKYPFLITYPQRIDREIGQTRDLSVTGKNSHVDEATFQLEAFDKEWTLDVKRNKHLISPSFAVRTFADDDTEIVKRDIQEHCHYQGTIRGLKDSTVVLNTCQGLRGIIEDGEGTYYIQPEIGHPDKRAHRLSQAKADNSIHIKCGNGYQAVHNTLLGKQAGSFSRVRRSISNKDEFYQSYLETDETRYNELVVVVDYGMYQNYNNDTSAVMDRVITLINAVDAIYQRINIRIVMKALEIWTTGDRTERKKRGGDDLSAFNEYRNKYLVPKFEHDNAQLLSDWSWDDCAGMAYVTGMCSDVSTGVNNWDYSSLIGPYVTVAHEMGHNFGFNHDTGTCKCLTPRGCIMGGHKTRIPGFSNCSMEGLKRIDDACLYNVPTYKSLNSYCGNGIREEGEECDCGTPEMCMANDPCCKPHGCTLKRGTQCSELHHLCCEKCLFKRQGALCRGVRTDCDVPEYCTGDSRDCPEDIYIKNGYPCNRTATVIQGNSNLNSVNRRDLNPRVTARYLRINPRYWRGWPCLRTDFLGCSTDEVSQTTPTPLRSYNNLCLTTKAKTCSPNDNSPIMWTSAGLCNASHLQFRLDEGGVLRHFCSGKLVCPENGDTHNGAKLVVSATCTPDDSKFERTVGRSLKHLKSGRCLHANGGWPEVDAEQVIWSGCDDKRLEIWFVKQDCVTPLGMENGNIPDIQITASSYRENNELPQYARLNNQEKYWCAKEKKNDEYLQVDLGEVKTVNTILIQGRGTWYYWVTGFHLYYSQDGQRWTSYSESGDKEHSNSICYLGKCSEIHETQCKDLWGASATNGNQRCYDKLNTEATGYGSCSPVMNVSCVASNVLCGQLQCEDRRDTPVVDFGWQYKKIALDDGIQCSAATLKSTDALGLGMVRDGTKCGNDKMCVNLTCQSFKELNIGTCKNARGIECGGRGVCTNKITCHCENAYNPDDGCDSVLTSRDGNWGNWSTWSLCDKGCDGGKRNRYRFCDSPFPQHGGADCSGKRREIESCNNQNCPVVISCHHLKQVGDEQNHFFPDGVYKIYPKTKSQPILAYCDMSRDGGGWTLLITSHTNNWNAQDVNLRNENSPTLRNDYSILQHADTIKNHINVDGSSFEYRLEAQSPGRWGGIWEAQRAYSFLATNNKQTDVTLVKKFDDWQYSDSGIEARMPWRDGARLTTSQDAGRNWWGSITGDDPEYHPAPWISGHLQESQPTYIWYWMREGPYKLPRSCMEVQFRGLQTNPVKDGVFKIKPPGKHPVKTYCDFASYGGGWTLLATSKTHSGWNQNNVKHRNAGDPSLNGDFSILGMADAIKDFDPSQEYFQYRIEADGANRWGGIWEVPRDYTFLSTCDKQTGGRLVKKFNSWDQNSNLGQRMPRLGISANLLLSSASSIDDPSGSLVYNSGARAASYMKNENPTPGIVRYWMREGVRLSCNDLKVHGERAGNVYNEDGFHMIRISDAQYLPVYCDMTAARGGFTLVVTSAHNSWMRAQVPRRNEFYPALSKDYSILNLADSIKNISNIGTFQYMLDAHKRRHWGGIFEAPTSYSFMSTSNKQTNVRLIRKFDNWSYSWYKSLNKRMPWFDASGTHHNALLTTSSSADTHPSGSILWGGSDRYPAEWIWDGGMKNPGVIWYWLNEDDCDEDRKPVDGGLTAWSEWQRCDTLCKTGKQKRFKTCSNPKPRCGGKKCDPKAVTMEEKSCNYCPESRIQTYGNYCVTPNSGECSPPDDAYLIMTKTRASGCGAKEMMFVIDWDGVLHHKCSGKVICPEGDNPTYGKRLMLKDSCDLKIAKHKRLPNNALQNLKNNFCVHPNGGTPDEGVSLVYWTRCNGDRLKLEFIDLNAAEA